MDYYRVTLCVSAVFAIARCPSVTLVDCIHLAEDIVKLLVWPGSPIAVVSRHHALVPNSVGLQNTRVGNFFRFSTEISICLEIGTWLLWNVNRKS